MIVGSQKNGLREAIILKMCAAFFSRRCSDMGRNATTTKSANTSQLHLHRAFCATIAFLAFLAVGISFYILSSAGSVTYSESTVRYDDDIKYSTVRVRYDWLGQSTIRLEYGTVQLEYGTVRVRYDWLNKSTVRLEYGTVR